MPADAGGDHLSGSRVAATLVQPTREHRTGRPLPAWPCSGWGLPSRPVTRPLVSSYLTVSPLPLPRPSPRESLRGDPGGTGGGRFVSVALSAGHPAWALPSTLPCGVRTFLDSFEPRPPGQLLQHEYRCPGATPEASRAALPVALAARNPFPGRRATRPRPGLPDGRPPC